ncbi:MAG: glycosyltransferase family 4 protein [Pirellulales bacterium]|nr:glycosyltransferase family 4 protein [Pirellulales bacterium]
MRQCPRVLFVESYPHVLYGQQRTMLSIVERLPQERMQPLVGVTGSGSFVDAVDQLGVDIMRFDYPSLLAAYGGAIYRYRGSRRARMAWQFAQYVLRARRQLREKRISAVFCNDLRGLLTVGLAARSLSIPVMIWDKLDRPHGWLDLLELPLANKTVLISEAVKKKFPRWQLQTYRRRLQTISNGVDLAKFDASHAIRRELGLRDGDLVVTIVGTITERKGHDRIFDVLPEFVARVPNAVLLIIGSVSRSGEDLEYFNNLPNRDHPNAWFLGVRDDIPEIMHSTDVLVVPSRHEGMGRVVLEAMACRKPVVGARAGGIQEVVLHEKTGLLFDGHDRKGLLDSLVRLCESPVLRESMGQAGRARVEQSFEQNTQLDAVLAILHEMMNTKG